MTKPSNPVADFKHRQGRPDYRPDENPAPGQYYVKEPESKNMTIGLRPDDKIANDNPAPGQYDPDLKLVKPSSVKANFGIRQERTE